MPRAKARRSFDDGTRSYNGPPHPEWRVVARGDIPHRQIYKVDRNGASSTFFNPEEEKYIWALAVDGKGNV